jgi:hypothetical protein
MMSSRYLVRLQADYRLSFQTGGTFKDIRIFAGAGVRLGR